MYQAKGKLVVIGDTVKVSDKFTKRTFVLETENGKFKEYPEFQLVNDKTSALNLVSVGDLLTVDFNIRGRQWMSPKGEQKYFVTLEAFKILAESPALENMLSKGAINPQASDFNDLPF